MRRAHVVILDGSSILGESTAQLLKRESDIEVTVMPYLDQETSLRGLLERLPDVILIDSTGPLGPEEILRLLSEKLIFMNVHVIYVHNDDNTIEVYQRRSVVATRSADLVALVREAAV